jgi:hypothetical protein
MKITIIQDDAWTKFQYVDQKLKFFKQCGNVIESMYFLEKKLNLWKVLLTY